jgi:phosphate transport system substrate-binding protein
VPIDDGKDENGRGPIAPTHDTIANHTYQPLSRPLFIYISRTAANRPEVRTFVQYYLNQGRNLVSEVGAVALPDQAYTLALERFAKHVPGSLFKGEGIKVGMTIDQVLATEPAP